MDFKYYLAPADTIDCIDPWPPESNLSSGEPLPQCSICSQRGYCLLMPCEKYGRVLDNWFILAPEIDVATLAVITSDLKDAREPEFFFRGCLNCLRAGRFIVPHVTDAGDIEANGLLCPTEGNRLFFEEAMRELSRTPNYNSYQDSVWLTHCNDFMAFLGEWGQEDFNKNAPNRDGQAMFNAVAQDSGLETEEWDELSDGYGFYVFQCFHCGQLRSYIARD